MSGATPSVLVFLVDMACTRYDGDVTISLSSGLSVRMPNRQLVVPEVSIDHRTGEMTSNSTGPDLLIDSMQDVNSNDMAQLGSYFLSIAYLMVNVDKDEFTLWPAKPTTEEDLVALDETSAEIKNICPPGASTIDSNSTEQIGPDARPKNPASLEDSGIQTGAIVGIAVGCVSALAFIGLAIWLLRRKRKSRAIELQANTHVQYEKTAYQPPAAQYTQPTEMNAEPLRYEMYQNGGHNKSPQWELPG